MKSFDAVTNPHFAFSLFGLSLAAGIVMSISMNDWMWLARSGAIASMGGFFASLRSPTAGFEPGMYITRTYNEADDPVYIENNVEEEWRNVKREEINHKVRHAGIVCIVVSTIIWGFGDLVGKYV